MSTVSSAEDSDVSEYSLSYVSKKRKGAKVESTSAPKRRLRRNLSVTATINQLRLSSSPSSSHDLSNLASGFEVEVNTSTNSDTSTTSDTDTNIKYINEANEEEMNWWSSKASLGSLGLDEER